MSNKINLLYAKRSSELFRLMRLAKIEDNYNWSEPFNDKDEKEIGRGRSYAVFPELQTIVDKNEKITIAEFKKCLAAHGIVSKELQTRVLHSIIQNRAGFHYLLGGFIQAYLIKQEVNLSQNSEADFQAQVINSGKVLIKYKSNYCDPDSKPIISINFSFSITPDNIKINTFEINKISNLPLAKKVFSILQESQNNFFISLLIYIKRLFGYDSELILDAKDKQLKSTTNARP